MENRPLEMTGDQFRAVVAEVVERLADHLDGLKDQPAWDDTADRRAIAAMDSSCPERGLPLDSLLDRLFGEYLPHTFNTASPGYLAFIPGGGIPLAAVADLIAGTINRYVGVWAAAPWLAKLEATVIGWFCRLIGFPSTAGGFLTTGGSLAGWTALATARLNTEGFDERRALVYTSDQVHHSLLKAVRLIGLETSQVRRIRSDGEWRIRLDDLEATINRDRAQGAQPWLVIGQAGTTNTGAVDDLTRLAAISREFGLWFHIDAAYGGFFMLTERGRELLKGIDAADSVVLDPHKGLFLPYGTGCILTRDQSVLRRAHSLTSDYMPDLQDDSEAVDFCEISPELSRDFRGLRVWLPIQVYGMAAFCANLDEKLDLTREAERRLGQMKGQAQDHLEIAASPQLTVLAFRLVRQGLADDQLNRLNRELLKRINSARRVFLTSTTLDGRYVIRIAILSFRTHREHVDECLELIERAMQEV